MKLLKEKHIIVLILVLVVSVLLLSSKLQESFEGQFELMHANKNGACGKKKALKNMKHELPANPGKKGVYYGPSAYLITK